MTVMQMRVPTGLRPEMFGPTSRKRGGRVLRGVLLTRRWWHQPVHEAKHLWHSGVSCTTVLHRPRRPQSRHASPRVLNVFVPPCGTLPGHACSCLDRGIFQLMHRTPASGLLCGSDFRPPACRCVNSEIMSPRHGFSCATRNLMNNNRPQKLLESLGLFQLLFHHSREVLQRAQSSRVRQESLEVMTRRGGLEGYIAHMVSSDRGCWIATKEQSSGPFHALSRVCVCVRVQWLSGVQ